VADIKDLLGPRPADQADVDAYRDKNMDGGVLTINVTQAKELDPQYNQSNDHRTLYGEGLHEKAENLARTAWKDNLKRPQEPAILDTHGREPGQLKRQIEEAKKTGAQVIVAHVLRDPLDAFQNGYIGRTMNSGRSFSADNNAESYSDGSKAVQEIQKLYAKDPDVALLVIDNRHGPGNARLGDLNSEAGYGFDKEAIKQGIIALANGALASGALDGPRHAVIVGKDPGEAFGAQSQAGGNGSSDSDLGGGQSLGQDDGNQSGQDLSATSETGPRAQQGPARGTDARRSAKPERTQRAENRMKAYRAK
jgi:hypothetical protein